MPGPTPKNPRTKQRRNKEVTAATLIDSSPLASGKRPALPKRADAWRKEVKDFWADVWSSPMATEYTQADVHGLFILADLVQRYYEEEKGTARTALAAEIRLQRQCYGLTPIDRRRLQWEIKRADGPAKPEKPKRPERVADPRSVLKAV